MRRRSQRYTPTPAAPFGSGARPPPASPLGVHAAGAVMDAASDIWDVWRTVGNRPAGPSGQASAASRAPSRPCRTTMAGNQIVHLHSNTMQSAE